jgi:NADP-dependent 3-hydroxy acid dehydrogenase YdfG
MGTGSLYKGIMKKLDGKIAIITGGGSGIGRGLALALGEEGCHVVVCGRRKEKIDQTITEVKAKGGDGIAVQADVSDPEAVKKLVEATLSEYLRVDILINNAGVGEGEFVHESEVEDWDKIMDINLKGAFLTTRLILPLMRQQRSGHIINISSESGLEYYQRDGIYGTSKHAMNAFGEYVQRENQDYNIRVNTICPGMVVTEMTENSSGLDFEKCLYPEDIADLAIWLLTRRQNIKIGTPILIQTMLNPWE